MIMFMRPLQSELSNKIKEHNSLILLDPRFREDDKFSEDDENVGLQQPHYVILVCDKGAHVIKSFTNAR